MVYEINKDNYMEDFKTFMEIQLNKYLKSKKGRKPCINSPEIEMVTDLIKDYWLDLVSTGYLNKKSPREKIRIFSMTTIIFPYTNIPSSWVDGIIYVDFPSFSSSKELNDTQLDYFY